jgi:hypothetical protein
VTQLTSTHYVLELCSKNPKQTGHCDHTEVRTTRDNQEIVSKCCWCGRESVVLVNMPAHGPHKIKSR